MDKVYVIKIGGNVIDHEDALKNFLSAFAGIKEKKILVHGGGKLATSLGEKLGIPQQMAEGRRITDAETLKVVTMVYAGYINKNIVALLQSAGANAIGLCGADANLITANKREVKEMDYGFAGDVEAVNEDLLSELLDKGLTVVLSPITHNKKGQLLNTNADTIASEIAVALSKRYDTTLVYCFEKNGVLKNADDPASVIPSISKKSYGNLKDEKIVFAGMIPKLDNAFAAIDRGVGRVVIGNADEITSIINSKAGTTITNE